MTRRAYPKPMVKRAHELKRTGLGYGRVARALKSEFGVRVGESTVRDWTTYYSRGPG